MNVLMLQYSFYINIIWCCNNDLCCKFAFEKWKEKERFWNMWEYLCSLRNIKIWFEGEKFVYLLYRFSFAHACQLVSDNELTVYDAQLHLQ